MKKTYITYTNCVTPLGFSVTQNTQALAQGVTGINLHNTSFAEAPFYAGIIDDAQLHNAFTPLDDGGQYSRLEKMLLLALAPVIQQSGIKPGGRTGLIISTTKGNITALQHNDEQKAALPALAQTLARFFGFVTESVIVSNACVSGILAVSVAKRLLQAGVYDDIFVVAGDEVSEFVISGFNSFQAMSSTPCRPYSSQRDGITIGEAAAAAFITVNPQNAKATISGDGAINDANHISGPSRTGEGLVRSIQSALAEAGLAANSIDYISAHGTATLYNDEMEAIAFNRAGLGHVPLNSLKGYYGHTLGASGLLEAVIAVEALANGELYPSLGYTENGVTQPVNIITEYSKKPLQRILKTASGFGGCNTAVVFEKTGNGSW
ncbi:beta-ketoacyl synthase N-terminal-like domain-containing protein [Flavobacterium rhizosphaerae]|uniref:Beta-ketoacyl synthase N-terminal-like domain-containing protein n=1 Tax=Flavobacterium rhizosphaerae TaxID=3163298 RepID=A0ABW8YWG2_9FLAO